MNLFLILFINKETLFFMIIDCIEINNMLMSYLYIFQWNVDDWLLKSGENPEKYKIDVYFGYLPPMYVFLSNVRINNENQWK